MKVRNILKDKETQVATIGAENTICDIVNVMRGECKVENRYLQDYISGKYPV